MSKNNIAGTGKIVPVKFAPLFIDWLFKNLHIIEERPDIFKERLFDRIFEVSEISKLKGEDLKKYRYSMRYVDERQLAIDCAAEEAAEVALAQGYRKGKADGIAKGMDKGIIKGMLNAAKSMLADGLDPARVARITKLPKKQIMALR